MTLALQTLHLSKLQMIGLLAGPVEPVRFWSDHFNSKYTFSASLSADVDSKIVEEIAGSKATIGSKEHKENMEEMAERIQGCIASGSFGGEQLRGVKVEDFIFDDEKTMTLR